MEEYILQIRNYLPVEYIDLENKEYIEYLSDAYLKNVEAEIYQFAFIAFHLLYMSFIYKTIWLLKKEKYENLDFHLEKITKELQIVYSPFDFSTIPEGKSFDILKCLRFHPNEIKILSSPVDDRNNCSHASGKIHYSKEGIERLISDELRNSEQILQKTRLSLETVLKKFINDNWDPDTREQMSSKEAVAIFIKNNLLSSKDIELLTSLVIPEMHEKSSKKRIIYIKTLYLIFLSVAQDYVDQDENLLLKNLPLLMHGFNKQSEISLETLINDEFSEILSDFSEKDKNIFAQTIHHHLPDFLLQANNTTYMG